jgi:hypothetical protein
MRNIWEEMIKDDPLAYLLLKDAANESSETKADRELLKNLKRETTALAEDFLNEY